MRVAPRSVIVVVAVSSRIFSTVSASDSTGAVQVMSPTVRKRTCIFDDFAVGGRRQSVTGCSRPVLAHHRAGVGEVDATAVRAFTLDVLPHVQLGPVADREGADVLALVAAGVVQVPQFRALVLRVPLAELVAEAHDALLGAGLFLVAAGAADAGVEAEFLDGFEQRHRLVLVARFVRRLEHHRAALHRVFHRAHDQPLTQFGGALVAEAMTSW
jgi:hypothetical protein